MAEEEDFNKDNPERRATRLQYRNIITDLQVHRDDLVNPQSEELQERLREVDENFKRVERAREAALDSQAMHLIANIGRMKAQALHTEFVRFQPTEFAQKLIAFVGGTSAGQGVEARISAQGWASLGRATQPFFRRSPPFQFVLGSFERGPKPVKERQQRAPREKESLATKETVPNQLKTFEGMDEGEATTEEVERVHKILRAHYRKHRRISYFEFVLNPDSFGHTVENIFHLSFLIKDGWAEMYLDEELQIPMIRPMDSERKKQASRDGKDQRRIQAIISITPGEWEELVQAFKVTRAQIPPRENVRNGHG
ncbi:EP300-interacting inhibitor of differentiation 3-like [Mya arenaria]|uniref:EP300-interacting inhibitor of differentiation 3-like n=1 Tax=Mya arenaria TaxID=6604 RepID=UPI0022DF20AF|nr:EP300-interacting inhibitor of differentiation 3-like [Mya arenaria]